MLNFDTVHETIDTSAINILKTSTLTMITEQAIFDSCPKEQFNLLKKTGACLTLQLLFEINWEVAQEMLINTISKN